MVHEKIENQMSTLFSQFFCINVDTEYIKCRYTVLHTLISKLNSESENCYLLCLCENIISSAFTLLQSNNLIAEQILKVYFGGKSHSGAAPLPSRRWLRPWRKLFSLIGIWERRNATSRHSANYFSANLY